jgi:hypothetical protein
MGQMLSDLSTKSGCTLAIFLCTEWLLTTTIKRHFASRRKYAEAESIQHRHIAIIYKDEEKLSKVN